MGRTNSKTIYSLESEILLNINNILSKQSQYRHINVILFDPQASSEFLKHYLVFTLMIMLTS
jgi:hypothetical protein